MRRFKWFRVLATIIIILLAVVLFISKMYNFHYSPDVDNLNFVKLEEGYKIEVFADDLGKAKVSIPGPNNGVRMIDHKDGVFYAAIPGRGQVVTIHDKDQDWKEDKRTIFMEGLLRPHGIALYQDWVYIAAEDKVIRVKDLNGDYVADLDTMEELVDLPLGTHWTRTIKIFDDQLYVSIGSTCNVCIEKDWKRAAIIKCDLDGSNCKAFATGLRNAVDFIQYEGKIWATDNGRDLAGKDIPPDEINIIKEGKDYGWPYCYGQNELDKEFVEELDIEFDEDSCKFKEAPIYEIPAHSAPLGLEFYEGDLLVALHGSWNRDPPVGYNVIRIDIDTGDISEFASGFIDGSQVYGRPMDLLIIDDNILLTDDVAGKIYRIYKDG
ncbi:PQQ-dependent sugar dehydrogenase [Candidatus Woesearchaeota archaeon]|nr:PQQ-dependent sugar dehydrogenase [Candidatus Woesearchaeota archaeon]